MGKKCWHIYQTDKDRYIVCAYIFYDSQGRALYVGRTEKQHLWGEMRNAFNRSREIQKIRTVNHPTRNQPFRTSEEKARQIVERQVKLYDLAHYFSAYEVAESMIPELEAMLVRGFANDLLNQRMERFDQQRSVRQGKTKRGKLAGDRVRTSRTGSEATRRTLRGRR